MKAGQEPSPESPVPGTDVVPAAPRKPRKFSKLVLLTASKDSAKVAGAKRKGVHCIMSLGVPGPATLAKALLKIHPEAQRAIEAPPQEPEQKRSKPDTGEAPRWSQRAQCEQDLPGAGSPLTPGNLGAGGWAGCGRCARAVHVTPQCRACMSVGPHAHVSMWGSAWEGEFVFPSGYIFAGPGPISVHICSYVSMC